MRINNAEVTSLVSVIVPVYNQERYLEQCVNSILNQTYPHLEIILVNNGSKDRSGAICKKFARQDRRVRVLEIKKNISAGNGRNTGLDAATGEYISFIDSDDWIKPEFIEKLLCALLENDVPIAQCCYERAYWNNTFSDTLPYHEFRIFSGREMCKIMNEFIGMCGPMTMMWNKLYRAELFKDFRFYEDVAYEDMYSVYKLLYPLERVAFIPDRLAYWRQHGSSGTSRYSYKHFCIHEMYAYEERVRFFGMHNDRELYRLALKRMYYIATQHLYLQKRYVKDSRNVQDWLLDKIADIYRELMAMDCWSARTRSRMRFIRRFPEQFGYWSLHHKVDFRI